ncbi:MAG: GGDEF domain-containing protein [Methylococcaceae bacterium]|nr:GGDEF domain-containing protein [Methylococcaceae bacterium]
MTQLTYQFDVEQSDIEQFDLKRCKGEHVAMLTLNFSDFEAPANSFNHEKGEQLLREIEQSIRQRLRDADSVVKINDTGFVVLLESLHTQDNAEKVADALVEIVSEALNTDGKKFDASVRVDFVESTD